LTITAVSIYICYDSIGYKEEGVDGIRDMVFEWSTPLNDYFKDEDKRNTLLITDSLVMDSLVVFQLIRFVFWGTTWRVILALILFYGLRALI
jgi:hypothetical protein